MSTLIIKNGKAVNQESLVSCLGLCGSVSVFESMCAYGGVIFKLDEHLVRLQESAKSVGLKPPLAKNRLRVQLKGALKLSCKKEAFIRLSVLGDDVFIFVKDKKKYASDIYRRGVAVGFSAALKSCSCSSRPEAKSSNFLNSIMGHLDNPDQSFFEVLFLGSDGYVKEGRISNIFCVKQNVLSTPPASGILCGITRNFVLECARCLGLNWQETEITRHNIYSADEVFLTNTSGGIIPVREVDSRVIGQGRPGKVTSRLIKQFKEDVRQYITRES